MRFGLIFLLIVLPFLPPTLVHPVSVNVLALNYNKLPVKNYLSGDSVNQQMDAQAQMETRKRNFATAGNLLRRKGVPFDPEILLQDDWPNALAPVFSQMPEMQESRYLDSLKEGVELADTLYLPEKVHASGDVVIVAKHLVFEGHDILIKGHHNISVFPAESVIVMGDTLPRHSYRKAGRLQTVMDLPDTRPADKGGDITIDTSGIGYKEWLESIGGEARLNKVLKALSHPDKRVRDAASREFKLLQQTRVEGDDKIGPLDKNKDTSGSAGSMGNIGAIGTQPNQASPLVQPKAANGVCGGDKNGSTGKKGADGGDAGGAGTGGTGFPGTPGNIGNYTIPDGDSQTWHFISHGGQGGPGGPGGFAYDGARGSTGGDGGDGADCNCAQGGTGDGGEGGPGGTGGRGGTGGEGGLGGNGNNGGPITVSVPCRSQWTGEFTSDVNPGGRGPGGLPTSAGSPGPAGDPGGGGRPGTNHNCSSSAGRSLGSGDAGLSGVPNDAGNHGKPGESDGNPGTLTVSTRSCGTIGGGGGFGCPGAPTDCPCGLDITTCYCRTPCGVSPILIDVSGNGFNPLASRKASTLIWIATELPNG